jgi:hypothetical protein
MLYLLNEHHLQRLAVIYSLLSALCPLPSSRIHICAQLACLTNPMSTTLLRRSR